MIKEEYRIPESWNRAKSLTYEYSLQNQISKMLKIHRWDSISCSVFYIWSTQTSIISILVAFDMTNQPKASVLNDDSRVSLWLEHAGSRFISTQTSKVWAYSKKELFLTLFDERYVIHRENAFPIWHHFDCESCEW